MGLRDMQIRKKFCLYEAWLRFSVRRQVMDMLGNVKKIRVKTRQMKRVMTNPGSMSLSQETR